MEENRQEQKDVWGGHQREQKKVGESLILRSSSARDVRYRASIM